MFFTNEQVQELDREIDQFLTDLTDIRTNLQMRRANTTSSLVFELSGALGQLQNKMHSWTLDKRIRDREDDRA